MGVLVPHIQIIYIYSALQTPLFHWFWYCVGTTIASERSHSGVRIRYVWWCPQTYCFLVHKPKAIIAINQPSEL